MKPIASLIQHPASALAAPALAALVTRFGLRLVHVRRPSAGLTLNVNGWARYAMGIFSGLLFTNALAQFSHGISGEPFPAPFGYALAAGFPEHLANMFWGSLNLVLGYLLFARSGVFDRDTPGKIAFFAGVLAMGVFLAYVFSRYGSRRRPAQRHNPSAGAKPLWANRWRISALSSGWLTCSPTRSPPTTGPGIGTRRPIGGTAPQLRRSSI